MICIQRSLFSLFLLSIFFFSTLLHAYFLLLLLLLLCISLLSCGRLHLAGTAKNCCFGSCSYTLHYAKLKIAMGVFGPGLIARTPPERTPLCRHPSFVGTCFCKGPSSIRNLLYKDPLSVRNPSFVDPPILKKVNTYRGAPHQASVPSSTEVLNIFLK